MLAACLKVRESRSTAIGVIETTVFIAAVLGAPESYAAQAPRHAEPCKSVVNPARELS